jgi:hypothetical protein
MPAAVSLMRCWEMRVGGAKEGEGRGGEERIVKTALMRQDVSVRDGWWQLSLILGFWIGGGQLR